MSDEKHSHGVRIHNDTNVVAAVSLEWGDGASFYLFEVPPGDTRWVGTGSFTAFLVLCFV